jgi:hypothetical protein
MLLELQQVATSHFGKYRNILFFGSPFFFSILFDATMTFVFPIVTATTLHSNFLMGVIIAFSSFISLCLDFIIPLFIRQKGWKFQLLFSGAAAIFFPLLMVLGQQYNKLIFFFAAGAAWAIYYEFLAFSQQNFIVKEESSSQYSQDWGLIFFIYSVAGVIAPILGSMLLILNQIHLLFILLTIQSIAFFLSFAILSKFPNYPSIKIKSSVARTVRIFKQVKIWETFIPCLFPVFMVGIMAVFVEATYASLAGIFGATLQNETSLDWLPMTLYCVALIIGSIYLSGKKIHQKKKMYSQMALLLGGIFLIPISIWGRHYIVIFLSIFFSSLFFSIVSPLNNAVYSDIQARSGRFGQELLGIAKMNHSIGYMIAPITMGALADRFGFPFTFGVLGIMCAVLGCVLLLFTPRKIKVPHTLLEKI